AGVDVNLRDAHGQTALFHAVAPFGGNLRVVKLLVDAGAALDVINDHGEDVITAGFAGVTAALEHASMRAIEAFLLEAGFDPALRRR
ncbi:MAG: hypothetical protein KC420_13490, partial [Myxococcales bacterium]|nr:hypothetical protein [Myxococcales bacterium]